MSYNFTRSDHDDDAPTLDTKINIKLYPGEFGNVEAWYTRSKLELSLQRQRFGNNPADVFQDREPMFNIVDTIEPPIGGDNANPDIGEAWINRPDGTPTIKKTLNFTPSVDLNIANNHEPPLAQIQIANKKYIDDKTWDEMRIYAQNFMMARIPDDHMHLVADVKSGDLEDFAVKIFGMSATNPKEFTKTMKMKIINNVISPHTFDRTAYRWLLDQYKVYGNIVSTDCDGSHKMPESDFMEIIVNELSKFIPTFTNIYHAAELSNEPWDLNDLKNKLKVLAEKGKLRIEPAVLANIEKKKATKKIKHQEAKNATPFWQTTGYGVDDQSHHNYAADAFFEGDQVTQDGMQRNDASSYYMGEQHGGYANRYGNGGQDWGAKGKGKGGDGKGEGKGGAYPYGKGGDGKGKGKGGAYSYDDGKGKGGKGKGGAYPYGKGKGGNGSKGDNKRWNNGGGYDGGWQANGGTYNEWDKVPAKVMWCTICAWHNKTRNATKHEDATCMLPGGGMEGQSIENCIWEQRRINMAYYEAVRNGEMNNQQGTATTKKARTEDADEEEQDEKKEHDDDEDEAENDKANTNATDQWYTSNSKMTKISIDETLLETTTITINCEAQLTSSTPPPSKGRTDKEINASNEQRKKQ